MSNIWISNISSILQWKKKIFPRRIYQIFEGLFLPIKKLEFISQIPIDTPQKQKNKKNMEKPKPIKNVYCPNCGKSLIFPNPNEEIKIGDMIKEKICLVYKNGKIPDRVILIKIVKGDGDPGYIEISLIPGDYQKYVSLKLGTEEEVTFVCPHCRKTIHETKELVKMLIEYETLEVVEYFIVPKYGIEVTLCYQEDGKIKNYYGEKSESLVSYFEEKLREIKNRKWLLVSGGKFLPSVFLNIFCPSFVHFFLFLEEYNLNVLLYYFEYMDKNPILFDQWNIEKKHIHYDGATWYRMEFYINTKEIWYAKLGINVWYEQDGKTEFKRAILVIKKLGNLFLVLPMTTKQKENRYHYKLQSFKGKPSWLILSQIKTIDKNRFIEKIGEIHYSELKNIKKNLSNYYFSDL